MNVLITYQTEIERLGIQAIIKEHQQDSIIRYAENLVSLYDNMITEDLDLLIVDGDMFEQNQLKKFVTKDSKNSKVIVLSEFKSAYCQKNFLFPYNNGIFLPKASSKAKIMETLRFL